MPWRLLYWATVIAEARRTDVGNSQTRAPAPRPERMERTQPIHRVDRRGSHRQGKGGGPGRREDPEGGGFRLRRLLHLLPQARHTHAEPRAGVDGQGVASGDQDLEAQRAPLRSAAGAQQVRDGREVRRGPGEAVEAVLRRLPALVGGVRQPQPRSPGRLQGRREGRPPPHREPGDHRQAREALLRRGDQAPHAGGRQGAHSRPRELPARPGDDVRRDGPRRDRRS